MPFWMNTCLYNSNSRKEKSENSHCNDPPKQVVKQNFLEPKGVQIFTPNDTIHLRIKRGQSTVFLLCYPEQVVGDVKEKLENMFLKPKTDFRLIYKEMVLDDEATIRSQQIGSNDVVQMVFKDEKSDAFEKPFFDDLDRLHFEYEAKRKESG